MLRCFLFLLILPCLVNAQIFPKEAATLNYRLIQFKLPVSKDAGKYTIELAKGNCFTADSFSKNAFYSTVSTQNKIIVEVPDFNEFYTWKFTVTDKSGRGNTSVLYHFKTGYYHTLDTNETRLRIVKKAEKYKDAYIFSDVNKVLYDMNGKPIWYLPIIPGEVENNSVIRDLKLSCKNTITLLVNDKPREIDYNGKVLWRAPRGGRVNSDSVERYHHEITRMSNGHYMTMGNELFPMVLDNDSIDNGAGNENNKPKQQQNSRKVNMKLSFGTLIEYDDQSQVVWYWKSSDFYKNIDFRNPKTGKTIIDIHQNAFFFDERDKTIRVSYKNINQVIKIKYPEGDIIDIFGGIVTPENPGDTLFCEQHACKVTNKGNLLLFNNNMNRLQNPPTLLMMSEPKNAQEQLKNIWEYTYPLDLKNGRRLPLTNGGNVIELPDESIFANLCTPYGNLFIVNKAKKLVWDAVLEKWNANDKKWLPMTQYRASVVNNRKALESLIEHQRD